MRIKVAAVQAAPVYLDLRRSLEKAAGEEAKLTVSFPGYGQKKFVAKYAALQRA